MNPLIQVKNLDFSFSKHHAVLQSINFEVPANRNCLLMGPSGCGKSTLASIIAGLLPENGGFIEHGTVLVHGDNISELSASSRCRLVSMMFQNPHLQFCMRTLRDEMLFCLENMNTCPEQMMEQVSEAARLVHAEHLLDTSLSVLSGGEKQRASLACLLLFDSRLWILDEPFANLDEDSAHDLAALLTQVQQERRAAGRSLDFLIIDHRADIWLPLIDDVYLMDNTCQITPAIPVEDIKLHHEQMQELGLFLPQENYEDFAPPLAQTNSQSIFSLKNMIVPLGNGNQLTVNAHFPYAQITCIIGNSAAGKTTFLTQLLTEHIDTERIGIVFQNPADQFFCQTLKEELTASLDCAGKSADINDLLSTFSLEEYADQSPFTLSQGQQRRLAVLIALAAEQNIVLLDEPTYGQDCAHTQAIMKLLLEACTQSNLSVIMTTHDRALATAYAHRIYRVADGGFACLR
ncbi:ABC transporter ATP-binding protein [Alloscardovia sp. HMSC034E08]|uniref:ABC transporter ATP-binding protein n=1 Tax=Alloscardovia sp. HMSC034E08 TaxID=1739413 RepID=UPI0008CEB4FB|nr:ABC transporter ATP-binding protein [Alloscardovia sp. HMSC034E08]OFQ99946.1 hypothetical protein HMPREF2909_05520 [Alloscardovia sp. HMSC034E08]